VNDVPRPAPRGKGERGDAAKLVLTSWEAYDPGTRQPGEPRFTVHAAIRTGDRRASGIFRVEPGEELLLDVDRRDRPDAVAG
jgi:hypothetical protein